MVKLSSPARHSSSRPLPDGLGSISSCLDWVWPHNRHQRARFLQKQLRSYEGHVRDLSVKTKVGEAAVVGNSTLTGRWSKLKGESDPMDEACDCVKLPWLYRKAMTVLNTLELEDSPEHFQTVLKAGGIMDVVERYPWGPGRTMGPPTRHKRRDKRRGEHTGRVLLRDGHPCLEVAWDDPYGGEGSDTFTLSDDGLVLTQQSEMRMKDGRCCAYKCAMPAGPCTFMGCASWPGKARRRRACMLGCGSSGAPGRVKPMVKPGPELYPGAAAGLYNMPPGLVI